jgi:hypothetical protein
LRRGAVELCLVADRQMVVDADVDSTRGAEGGYGDQLRFVETTKACG